MKELKIDFANLQMWLKCGIKCVEVIWIISTQQTADLFKEHDMRIVFSTTDYQNGGNGYYEHEQKSVIGLIATLALASSTIFTPIASAESAKDLLNDSVPSNAVGEADVDLTDSQVGYISPAEKSQSAAKSTTAQKVMEIHEKSISAPQSITEADRAIVQSYINTYFPDASIDRYIISKPEETDTMRGNGNPGDYQNLNLNLPGEVQATNYYCGPASGVAVMGGMGISVRQSTMASLMHTNQSGTSPGNVAPALNHYSGTYNHNFHYALLSGPGSFSTQWAIEMTNDAISTLLGNDGVIYDVHIAKNGHNYLQYYNNDHDVYHYVAGEGFNSSDPSNRVCLYYDSNNQRNLPTRHNHVSFHCMSALCDDRGLVF